MTTIRNVCCNDLLHFASANLDHFAITGRMSLYMKHLIQWPDHFKVAVSPAGRIMGYIMGEIIGEDKHWHGHVTAVSVIPEYRRQKIGMKLMTVFEEQMLEKMFSLPSDRAYVGIYVGATNVPAIKMCAKLGYIIYSRMREFYTENEDGLDMRKSIY